jgi:ribosomal protein S18 acetylase RimI-like enzyme
VHPDYARKGIGTILLRAVLKEARKRGYKKVQAEAAVMNAATVRLDKRRGFRIE